MKRILFFETSHSLHKSIQLILSSKKHYQIKIVETTKDFENEIKNHDYNLIISNSNLKNYTANQDYLIMYEEESEIKKLFQSKNIYTIQKPFLSLDFKNKVDSILGIENSLEIEKNSTEIIEMYAKEMVDKWLKEQAPHLAKEVIREEIQKLIS